MFRIEYCIIALVILFASVIGTGYAQEFGKNLGIPYTLGIASGTYLLGFMFKITGRKKIS